MGLMKAPKTVWNYSSKTEAERVVFTLKQTLNRFYAHAGFLVLPYLIFGNGKTVFLPDLSLPPGFLAKVKKLKIKNFADIDAIIVSEIAEKLPNNENSVDQTQKQWQKSQKAFWQEFFCLFPRFAGKIKSLEIRPTAYGSLSSFNTDFKKKGEIIVYLRRDMDISHLAEAIISSIFADLETENYDWSSQEAVTDFLLTKTALMNLFPGYRTTAYLTGRHESAKATADSRKFLKKMGVDNKKIFSLKNEDILIEGRPIDGGFSATEKGVLSLLVRNKNRLVSFDRLGETIWGNQAFEKYSDWALAKMVQRLRDKIEDFGVSPCVIQTKRKEGYILAD